MRLIDADELIEHAWRDKLDSRELIVEMIERAPTVKSIPTQIPIDVYERLLKQEPIDVVLDSIKADVEQYQADCDLSCSDDSNCRTCNNITFGSIYRFIDKYKKGEE